MVICRICKTEVEKYTNGTKCKACYNEYMAKYMLKRYHDRRNEAIELLGGQCVNCGSIKDLELDHVDSSKKNFDIAKLLSRGKTQYLKELDLCQVLCSTCHKSKTLTDLGYATEHGQGITGKRNCYCELCKPLKRVYMRTNKYRWKKDYRAGGTIGSAKDS